jgi:hypothetical protein
LRTTGRRSARSREAGEAEQALVLAAVSVKPVMSVKHHAPLLPALARR